MSNTMQADAIGSTTVILVWGSWCFFGFIFLLRKRPPKIAASEAKRASSARWGIVMQGLGFGLVAAFRRSHWWPFAPSAAGELIFATFAIALAWASNFWCLRSVQMLGKQWAVQPRVLSGHELITRGPYGIVRNPIYLGMFGLMIASGLASSRWWAILGAIIVFLIGLAIRIRAEEGLLRDAFGAQFEDYSRRVPAFVPHIF